jgi:hypothetical protein
MGEEIPHTWVTVEEADMVKAFFVNSVLVTLFWTLALTGYSATPVRQASASGKIVGRVIERESGIALAAEIGLTSRAERTLTLTHVRAADQGTFEIDGQPPGDVHLVTKLEGYASEHQSVHLDEGETKYVEFRLSKVETVQGIVLDPSGCPIPGANVRVIYSEEIPARNATTTTYQWESGEVKSDGLGNFALDVHPEKEFIVEASHPEFMGAISTPVRIDATEKNAFVGLILDEGIRVIGEVRDGDGNIIQGAQVRLIAKEPRSGPQNFTLLELLKQRAMYTVTGANGTFRFDHVGPASKELIIVHPRYQPFRQTIDLNPNQKQLPARIVLRSRF